MLTKQYDEFNFMDKEIDYEILNLPTSIISKLSIDYLKDNDCFFEVNGKPNFTKIKKLWNIIDGNNVRVKYLFKKAKDLKCLNY